jgi:hypothetical protein
MSNTSLAGGGGASPAVPSRLPDISRLTTFTTSRTDWVVFALPAVTGLRAQNGWWPIPLLAVMALIVVMRRQTARWTLAAGPFLVFAAASGIVLSRPAASPAWTYQMVLLAFVTVITVFSVMTTDGRTLIASLIDGLGFFIIANLAGFLVGLRSLGAAERTGGIDESTGFIRVFFPFVNALDEATIIAAIVVAATPILIVGDKHWRWFRVVCVVSGLFVAWAGASRTALIIAVALPAISILFVSSTRWMAPVAAVFASFSALLVPLLTKPASGIIETLTKFLAPGRDTRVGDIETLSNRSKIWSRSMEFWLNHVRSLPDQLFGFGQYGQVRSGVSLSYSDILSAVSRHPRTGTVHNSFLQQLFDGGLLGWLLLTISTVWAGVRLYQRTNVWGIPARSAVVGLSALLIGSTVGVAITPGNLQTGFLILMFFVAVSCQVPATESAPGSPLQSERPEPTGAAANRGP